MKTVLIEEIYLLLHRAGYKLYNILVYICQDICGITRLKKVLIQLNGCFISGALNAS